MRRDRAFALVSYALLALGIGVALAGCVVAAPGPVPLACPAGYYFDPDYGCVPPAYLYGPPYYAEPGVGFDFFYGGRWGGYDGRAAPPPRGGAPRGPAPHRDVPSGVGGRAAPHGVR